MSAGLVHGKRDATVPRRQAAPSPRPQPPPPQLPHTAPAYLPRTVDSLVRMAARGESLQRWRAATHLIIDEVGRAHMADWGRRTAGSPQRSRGVAVAGGSWSLGSAPAGTALMMLAATSGWLGPILVPAGVHDGWAAVRHAGSGGAQGPRQRCTLWRNTGEHVCRQGSRSCRPWGAFVHLACAVAGSLYLCWTQRLHSVHTGCQLLDVLLASAFMVQTLDCHPNPPTSHLPAAHPVGGLPPAASCGKGRVAGGARPRVAATSSWHSLVDWPLLCSLH